MTRQSLKYENLKNSVHLTQVERLVSGNTFILERIEGARPERRAAGDTRLGRETSDESIRSLLVSEHCSRSRLFKIYVTVVAHGRQRRYIGDSCNSAPDCAYAVFLLGRRALIRSAGLALSCWSLFAF